MSQTVQMRLYAPRTRMVRSWRTLWRWREVEEMVVIFAGYVSDFEIERKLNSPGRASITVDDPMKMWTERRVK